MAETSTNIVILVVGICLSYWFFSPASQIQQQLDQEYDYVIGKLNCTLSTIFKHKETWTIHL